LKGHLHTRGPPPSGNSVAYPRQPREKMQDGGGDPVAVPFHLCFALAWGTRLGHPLGQLAAFHM
jgi:hypothetical protein